MIDRTLDEPTMTPEELARQVRLLEITTRHLVTEVFAGEYSSAFKGRGVEFADVREYQPGDDVRTIDWNVTARAGKPFVKRFSEERELMVVLAVDLSSSAHFGTQAKSKQAYAAEVAALVAFAAAKKGDLTGLLVFTDRAELWIPPKKGGRHALRLVRELLAFRPTHAGTSFDAAGEHLARVLRRKSVIFFVSDFQCDGVGDAMSLLAPRHDLVAMRVGDPREHELPSAGIIDVRDPETGAVTSLDTSSSRVRAWYRDATTLQRERVDDAIRRSGADEVDLSTDDEYIHHLIELFRRRERRR
jgi:uncharacterized protein (DUF58 family)